MHIVLYINSRDLRRGVKSMIKLEHAAEIDRIYDQTNFDLTGDNPSVMHEGVRRAMHVVKHKNSKTFRVCDSDGCPAASLHDERVLFQNHFAKVFQAQVKPFRDLIDDMRNGPKPNYGEIIPEDLSAVLRTRVQLSADCRLNRKANACGEDLVVPEIYAKHPKCLSNLLFPLRTKTVLKIAPPLQWRGGMVSELFKGKGCSSMCSNYRDIMLADVSGKNFSKLLRHNLVPAARRYVVLTQYGAGMNAGDTSKAHVYLKSMIDISSLWQNSLAILFLDIVSAFASLLRRIVFDVDLGDEAWFHSLVGAVFTQDEVCIIYHEVCDSLWSALHANTVSLALATCMYQYTWASTEGVPHVMHTSTGSSAGTPLADLMYVIAMSKVMYKLRESLSEEGLVSQIDINEKMHELYEVGYVDDSAIPVFSNASQLVSKTCKTAQIAYSTFF